MIDVHQSVVIVALSEGNKEDEKYKVSEYFVLIVGDTIKFEARRTNWLYVPDDITLSEGIMREQLMDAKRFLHKELFDYRMEKDIKVYEIETQFNLEETGRLTILKLRAEKIIDDDIFRTIKKTSCRKLSEFVRSIKGCIEKEDIK